MVPFAQLVFNKHACGWIQENDTIGDFLDESDIGRKEDRGEVKLAPRSPQQIDVWLNWQEDLKHAPLVLGTEPGFEAKPRKAAA